MTVEAGPAEHGCAPKGANRPRQPGIGRLGGDEALPGPDGRQSFAAAVSTMPAALETRALQVCRRWSFGMYLLHAPLIVAIYVLALRHDWPLILGSALPVQLLFTAICMGATIMLAALSWRLFEQPILGLKRLFPLDPQPKVAVDISPAA